MSVWSRSLHEALDKVGITLSINSLGRRGEESKEERKLGLNESLGSLVEREKEGRGL